MPAFARASFRARSFSAAKSAAVAKTRGCGRPAARATAASDLARITARGLGPSGRSSHLASSLQRAASAALAVVRAWTSSAAALMRPPSPSPLPSGVMTKPGLSGPSR